MSVRAATVTSDDKVLLSSLIGPPEASRNSLVELKRNVCGPPLGLPRLTVEHTHLTCTVTSYVPERTTS